MQLVPFHGRRVGFWLASSPRTARAELSAAASPVEHGAPSDDGVTLVVAAAEADDRIAWSHLLHAGSGAALCAEWADGAGVVRLVVGVGNVLRVLDGSGAVVAALEADDELVNAHVAEGALVLVGRGSVRVLDAPGRERWSRKVASGGLACLGVVSGVLRFAAFPAAGDDWYELAFDFGQGTPRAA